MMFDKLIDDLEKNNLLSPEQQRLLKGLRLENTQQLAESLHVDNDKHTLLALCDMCAFAKYVSHPIDNDDIVNALVALTRSRDWEVRYDAISALGRLDAKAQSNRLLKIALNDKHESVQLAALMAMLSWTPPESAYPLTTIINDPNRTQHVRELATETLGAIDSGKGITHLLNLLRHKNVGIRYTAISTLRTLIAIEAISYIKPLVDDHAEIRPNNSISELAKDTLKYLEMQAEGMKYYVCHWLIYEQYLYNFSKIMDAATKYNIELIWGVEDVKDDYLHIDWFARANSDIDFKNFVNQLPQDENGLVNWESISREQHWKQTQYNGRQLPPIARLDEDAETIYMQLSHIGRLGKENEKVRKGQLVMKHTLKETMVQAQLDAYNNRDIEAFMTVFAVDCVIQLQETGEVLMTGHEAIKEAYTKLFDASPDLHCELRNRIVQGDFVIDHEHVTGRMGDTLDVVAIYKVLNGLISHVWFVK